jgi:hypothetical protein
MFFFLKKGGKRRTFDRLTDSLLIKQNVGLLSVSLTYPIFDKGDLLVIALIPLIIIILHHTVVVALPALVPLMNHETLQIKDF